MIKFNHLLVKENIITIANSRYQGMTLFCNDRGALIFLICESVSMALYSSVIFVGINLVGI